MVAMVLVCGAAHAQDARVAKLERSFWVHASLATDTRRGYWGPSFAEAKPPTEAEVRRAARAICGGYHANRLYLVYHGDIARGAAVRVFGWWRQACPNSVEIVPTFVLRMYDQATTPVFGQAEAAGLFADIRKAAQAARGAVFDVYPNRDQGPALAALVRAFGGNALRVGIQPGEKAGAEVRAAVQDTWSGFCDGRADADWRAPRRGAEMLRKWVEERNAGTLPIAWDLIAVAWDYLPTKTGEYPGYDDAAKNMALPAGRNMAAARLILDAAKPEVLAGLSSDLTILEANSKHAAQDGEAGAFYACLRAGRRYAGKYAAPLDEIGAIYGALAKGRMP